MGKHKPRSIRIGRIYPNLAAPLLNGQLTDGQAQAGSLHIFVQLLETFEHPFLFVQWNAATSVRHREYCNIPRRIRLQLQGYRTFFCKLVRIGKQIYHNLL